EGCASPSNPAQSSSSNGRYKDRQNPPIPQEWATPWNSTALRVAATAWSDEAGGIGSPAGPRCRSARGERGVHGVEARSSYDLSGGRGGAMAEAIVGSRTSASPTFWTA